MCMVIGVLTFPAGWDADVVREVCGPQADDYNPGQCGVRWAYILAVIGVCDCGVLAALAFVLGTRYVKLLPENYITSGSLYKGEVNSAFIADQNSPRKASNIQPVMVPPSGVESDHYSEYSHHTMRSSRAFNKQDNSFSNNSVANFQL
ncbi:hypothetical protein JTE90_000864 [Oedothorax gibbosus]|uniref:LHFPL tetraspan subfamily member 4 protein n=1 Tax=Oedothorax gibbosus TaxID=931172 RepID=A0AAV6VVF7_9ARAC|nr:hypothetical protein JTE90_000864 [Oedothorax gibbosus]